MTLRIRVMGLLAAPLRFTARPADLAVFRSAARASAAESMAFSSAGAMRSAAVAATRRARAPTAESRGVFFRATFFFAVLLVRLRAVFARVDARGAVRRDFLAVVVFLDDVFLVFRGAAISETSRLIRKN